MSHLVTLRLKSLDLFIFRSCILLSVLSKIFELAPELGRFSYSWLFLACKLVAGRILAWSHLNELSFRIFYLAGQVCLLLVFTASLFLIELYLFILKLHLGSELTNFALLVSFFFLELELLLAHLLYLLLQRSDSSFNDFGAFRCLTTQLILNFHQFKLILTLEWVLIPHEITGLVHDHAVVMVANLADKQVSLTERLLKLTNPASLGD